MDAQSRQPFVPVVYLHGFNSGPQSLKAGETRSYMERLGAGHLFHSPRLSPHPAMALAQAENLIRTLPGDTLLIGSSLGGFYATWLAEKLDRRAVLINPAVVPDLDLAPYVGEQENPYTGERYILTRADLDTLFERHVERPEPSRYWLVLGARDEVLDWRIAARHFRGARQTVFSGDDHRLARWPECLESLPDFARA
ncbi:YqiA/YcfP family alpha/beta fold hydrolase [Paludibacterium paludis]|uniref:Esterase YqiA n=1 Tax=Paludibacterium paludis TaxID=1225769 RepID=A0A918P1N8_9NEIS|nr:YqiA/YcfP family alpha/beta fold hydrolase [Paludibacterium paludis]GGY12657.1 esterase YqiA [Paludibacterium paludis]